MKGEAPKPAESPIPAKRYQREVETREAFSPPWQTCLGLSTALPKGRNIGVTVDSTLGVEEHQIRDVKALLSPHVDESDPLVLQLYRSPSGLTSNVGFWHRHHNLINVEHDIFGKAIISTSFTPTEVNKKKLLPIIEGFSKVGYERMKKYAVDRGLPNTFMRRSVFTTVDPEIYWLGLDSFASKLDHEFFDNPLRRLYVDPKLSSVKEYMDLVKEIDKLVREYNYPLSFKALFAGEEERMREAVVKGNDTRIVFYFDQYKKPQAIAFGRWLSQRSSILRNSSPGGLHATSILEGGGKLFNGGVVFLAKGTKEERRKLWMIGEEEDLDRMRQLSIVAS